MGDGTIAYEGNEDLESSYPYMTLLATEPVVENQVFNTYLDERPSAIEGYNDATKYPNSYITSSIRAYFNRNQGGYPGTYSSMTGKKMALQVLLTVILKISIFLTGLEERLITLSYLKMRKLVAMIIMTDTTFRWISKLCYMAPN